LQSETYNNTHNKKVKENNTDSIKENKNNSRQSHIGSDNNSQDHNINRMSSVVQQQQKLSEESTHSQVTNTTQNNVQTVPKRNMVLNRKNKNKKNEQSKEQS